MKKQALSFFVWLLSSSIAFGVSPVIWGSSGARNLQNVSNVGTGTGAKNYAEPSMNSVNGWAASSGAVTVVTETTAANWPRATTASGIRITGVSGSTAYAFFGFTLDQADYSKKLLLQFDQAPISGYAASDFKVDVYSCTVAWTGTPATTCSGTSTRLALSTDTSAISALPLLTGTYRSAFDAPGSTAPYLQVRVGLNGTNTHALTLSDVYVGPGTVQQGAALSTSINYTPTWGNITLGNGTTDGYYRRVGDYMEVFASITMGSTTTFGGNFSVTLPGGFTPVIPTTNKTIGTAFLYDNSATVQAVGTVLVTSGGSVLIAPDAITASSVGTTIPWTWATSDILRVEFRLPIAEWAGSGGVVNLVQNDVVYYYGTGGTWGTTSTVTTAIGPGGGALGTTTPGSTSFVYTFTPTYPVSLGSTPILETSPDGVHWSAAGNASTTLGSMLEGLRYDGTNFIGGSASVNADGTIAVRFGKYVNGTATTWAGVTGFWRVKVAAPGAAVGFGAATSTVSGLVSHESTVTYSSSGLTFAGNSAGPSSYTLTFYRVGKQVTVSMKYSGITMTAGQTLRISGFSSDYYPVSDKWTLVPVIANAVNNTSAVAITSGGVITIYRDTNASTWTAVATDTAGVFVSFTYTVN